MNSALGQQCVETYHCRHDLWNRSPDRQWGKRKQQQGGRHLEVFVGEEAAHATARVLMITYVSIVAREVLNDSALCVSISTSVGHCQQP